MKKALSEIKYTFEQAGNPYFYGCQLFISYDEVYELKVNDKNVGLIYINHTDEYTDMVTRLEVFKNFSFISWYEVLKTLQEQRQKTLVFPLTRKDIEEYRSKGIIESDSLKWEIEVTFDGDCDELFSQNYLKE